MQEIKDNVENLNSYYVLCQGVGVTPLGYTDLSEMECRVEGDVVFTGKDLYIKEYFNFPPFTYDKQIKIS